MNTPHGSSPLNFCVPATGLVIAGAARVPDSELLFKKWVGGMSVTRTWSFLMPTSLDPATLKKQLTNLSSAVGGARFKIIIVSCKNKTQMWEFQKNVLWGTISKKYCLKYITYVTIKCIKIPCTKRQNMMKVVEYFKYLYCCIKWFCVVDFLLWEIYEILSKW